MTMEKIIQFEPAFDKRHPDPSQNYGIHGVDLVFVLKGPEGAVQFRLFTNWQLPHVTRELVEQANGKAPHWLKCMFLPMPADLGYHSYRPMYEGQSPITESCPFLDGKPCYYDGSGLAAQPVYERLLRQGDAGVWAALEEHYRHTFGPAERPTLDTGN